MGIRTKLSSMGTGFDVAPEVPADVTNWRYTTNADTGIRTLCEYLGSDTDVEVPRGYTEINHVLLDDYSNTSDSPFCNKKNIISVDLNKVPFAQNDASYAFWWCNKLETVTNLNSNIKSMAHAFERCYKLTSAPPTIPNSVTNITSIFHGCYNLNTPPKISKSLNVTDMYRSFSDCYRLTVAPTIPDSVTSMVWTFEECRYLVNPPTIPDSVTLMRGTFENCHRLTTAPKLSNSVTNIIEIFANCQNITIPPVIPESVIYMENAFKNCRNLTIAPNIPNLVIRMTYTFSQCVNMTGDIYIHSNNIGNIAGGFTGTKINNVYIPFYYSNGVFTKTYNTFNGYFDSNTGTLNISGVGQTNLYDINSI